MIYSSLLSRFISLDSRALRFNRRCAAVVFQCNNRFTTYAPRAYQGLTYGGWNANLCPKYNRNRLFFSTEKPPPGFGKFSKDPEPSETHAQKEEEQREEKPQFNLADLKKNYQKFRKDEDPRDDSKPRWAKLLEPSMLFIVGLTLIIMLELADASMLRNEVTMQEFISKYLIKAYVDRIQVVNKDFCRCYISETCPNKAPRFVTFRIGSVEAFEQKLDDIQVSRT